MFLKIKNIKLSFLVLAVLIILSYGFFSFAQEKSATNNNIFLDSDQDGLSDAEEKTYGTDPKNSDTDGDGYSDGAEMKSGYDPLKPAPGDRIVPTTSTTATEKTTTDSEKNLTKQVAKEISSLAEKSDSENPEISLDDINALMEKSLSESFDDAELPEISKDEIKIKKQNYGKLSDADALARKKEDLSKYASAVYYIFSSNSPRPITTDKDITAIISSYSKEIISSISSGAPEQLNGLSESGEKILEQMKLLEVPEDLVEMHIKGLQFAAYASALKDMTKTKDGDPLAYLASLAKIQVFIEALINFSDEISEKMDAYGLQTDEILDNEIKKLGLPVPEATTPDVPADNSAASDDKANEN